jgi:iron-sulfur cluster protein
MAPEGDMANKRARREQIRRAVRDSYLKLALERSATAYASARKEAMKGVDFESLQSEVRCIKERSISRIRELADRFRAEAERVGVVVYEAKDAAAADAYVARVAAERGVKLAVKSKSMLTEEIGLNPHLEASGVKVVETDLGEWIIQLSGERPSHFTQPAVHKTREQVAELFSKVVGRKVEPDIPELVEIARKELRQAFVEADMGISGANILIAETGTMVIVTNEGNSRLVTTFPPVHVAVVGYEKLVETMDDANSILKLLSKSGTGQRMTAYVSYITGPSRTTDIEKTLAIGVHGPKEVHVVLVDNGRMKMGEDEEIREALYCIKCGACLNVCPVYRAIGGHAYSNAYMGGIGAVVTAFHRDLEATEETIGLCNGCRKCVTVCPARVDVPEMTIELRRRLVEQNGLGWTSRLLLKGLLKNPDVMRRGIDIARALQTPFARSGRIAHAPFVPDFRTTPAISGRPLRERIPSRLAPEGVAKTTVALYPGCMAEFLFPEIGESAARVMVANGAAVVLPSEQACCGAPAVYSGDFETAVDLARRNIEALESCSAEHIVTVCPTCAVAIAHEFPKLLSGMEWEGRALAIAAKVRDFSDFALNVLNIGPTSSKTRVTYHDPCHQARGIGGSKSPRALLAQAGMELVEMPESDVCCGFAGSYSMKLPEVSESILARKLTNIESVEPEFVVTDCPGCIMQIRGGLEKRGSEIRVCHMAELLCENDHS